MVDTIARRSSDLSVVQWRRKFQHCLGFPPIHCGKFTADHCRPAITSFRQTRARLVPQMVGGKPPAHHQRTTISQRAHGIPQWHCNATSTRQSSPPRCRGKLQGIQGYKGLVLPPTNCITSHPGGKCLRRDVYPNLDVTHHLSIIQCEKRDHCTNELFTDLYRAQHPLTNIIFPVPPPGAHPRDPIPGRPNRIVPPS